MWLWFWMCHCQKQLSDLYLRHFMQNCSLLRMNVIWPLCGWVNTGSGNVLVLSGSKPLPEPILTKISKPCIVTWLQWVNWTNKGVQKNVCFYDDVGRLFLMLPFCACQILHNTKSIGYFLIDTAVLFWWFQDNGLPDSLLFWCNLNNLWVKSVW